MAYALSSPGVYVNEVASGSAPIAGAGTSTAAFIGSFDTADTNRAAEKAVVSCTNFTEFKNAFGGLTDLPEDLGHLHLAQAVYGFFQNGGTHCYVTRIKSKDVKPQDFADALTALEPLDDISIVAAPGMMTKENTAALITHCSVTQPERVAIFDSPRGATYDELQPLPASYSGTSNHVALYYPWIEVANPNGSAPLHVPPSGHIAGIFSRVDASRGVHKAAANEVIYGAIGIEKAISRSQQDSLNPHGINCIRRLNGNIMVWGARTLGSNNGEFTYLPVRRLLNFLRVSIDRGTQWTVFEPNGPDLWAKVIRNVSAFLKSIWAAGALFGRTPEQAFYVKCDEENNPQSGRDLGYLIVEIGVAVVKPAEFVVFNISQWSGPQK